MTAPSENIVLIWW